MNVCTLQERLQLSVPDALGSSGLLDVNRHRLRHAVNGRICTVHENNDHHRIGLSTQWLN